MTKLLLAIIAFVFVPMSGLAQSDVQNRFTATAAASVTYDSNTGLFTYSYVNIRAPQGWIGTLHPDQMTVDWCACAEDGILIPLDFVDKGQIVPSIYQIKPGQTLAGFVFQSPDPPSFGSFHAGGFVQIPSEGVDFAPGFSPNVVSYPDSFFAGQTESPLRVESAYGGGRRPAVDGFLTFMTLRDGDSKPSPVLIDIVFGPNGETVYVDTFRAVLNGVDITSQFVAMATNRKRVYLRLGSTGGLKSGVNVLNTSVAGMVPGATNTATDTDRVMFLVQ